MGCAVISMNAVAVRQAIVAAFPDKDAKVDIGGHQVSIKAHVDKETKQDIPTDIFAGWGHKAEKNDPLSEQALADFFDKQHEEFVTRGLVTLQDPGRVLTEEEKRAIAQRTAAAQGQWAAAGGVSPLARQPAAVGLVPGTAAAAAAQAAQQAQQQQYMAAMQAQYLMRMQQQQQYLAAVQAQQAQQQQYLLQRQQQEARAARDRRAGYKASFRYPTDEEVQAKLKMLASPGASQTAEAPAEETPDAPAGDAAEAAPAEAAPVAEA